MPWIKDCLLNSLNCDDWRDSYIKYFTNVIYIIENFQVVKLAAIISLNYNARWQSLK